MKPKTYMEVIDSNTCRFIKGDPLTKKAKFCGRPLFGGSSYCKEHYELSYLLGARDE